MTPLPPLPGHTFAIAHSINNHGEIVGQSSSSAESRPVIWRNGIPQDLGALGVLAQHAGAAFANNDAGDVVGKPSTADGSTRAFVLRDGIMTDLGAAASSACPPRSGACGMNENGEIVGMTQIDCKIRPVLWTAAGMQLLPPLDPDIPYGQAQDINEHGDIVGFTSDTPATGQAVLWRAGTPHYLGTLSGDPTVRSLTTDINDHGLAVGSSCVDATTPYDHAVTYLLEPPDAAALLAALIVDVNDVGPAKSLANQLAATLASLEAEDKRGACGALRAFSNHVRAQAGKLLNRRKAGELIAAAAEIRTMIGC